MARKRYTAEEIICHVRTVEIEAGKGLGIADACRKLGITEQLRDELLNGELFYNAARSPSLGRALAPSVQHAAPASCAGVSATQPRDPHLRAGQRVGVKELERWPNNWGQGTR